MTDREPGLTSELDAAEDITCECGQPIVPCSCPAAVCIGWIHPGALHGCTANGPFDGRQAHPGGAR